MDKVRARGVSPMTPEALPAWFSLVEDNHVLQAMLRTDTVMDEAAIDRIEKCIIKRLTPRTDVLIDCTSTVRHASTRFLNMLVSLQRVVRVQGGDMAVCGLLPEMTELLQITTLNRSVALFATSEQAFDTLARRGTWKAGTGKEIGLASSTMDGLFRIIARLSPFSSN